MRPGNPAWIVDSVRTAFGRCGGALAAMCIGVGPGIALAIERA